MSTLVRAIAEAIEDHGHPMVRPSPVTGIEPYDGATGPQIAVRFPAVTILIRGAW